ncbi:MAG: phosphotransferase family protein [Gammaproteobacteria bacterium]|nr:phosphotransferase family protein [Gammaproteobacteria bacterium]
MTDLLNPFDALDLVPGWDPEQADIEELKGGLTNRTFHVRQGQRECVMRLDSERSRMFRFDRSSELAIQEEAAKAGLAPGIVFSDADAGILVTEFIPGRTWEEADLASDDRLEALAALLRRVHALPKSGLRIDMTLVGETYQAYLEKRQGLHAFATVCVDIIRGVRRHKGSVCCHNDIVAANIVGDSDLRLIDWEFSCNNDPMFDLASAIGFHNLNRQQSDVLLDAYSGGSDSALRERLDEQLRVYDAIQWLWLATRHLHFPKRWQAKRLEELQQRIR